MAVSSDVGRLRNFVGGEWVDAVEGETMEVVNPATGDVIAHVPRGSAADVERAVEAAARALPEWLETTPAERAEALLRLADALERNKQSGYGEDMSLYAVEEYTQVKHVMARLD